MTIAATGTAVPRIVTATKADAPDSATSTADPNRLVGKGSTFDRWMGGIAGFGVGVGALMGVTALTEKSTLMPVRIGGAVLGVGALVGAPYLGQKLTGHLSRSTQAEAERARGAERADVDIKHRIDVAKVTGDIDGKALERAEKLRDERRTLAEGRPDQHWFAKWGIPAIVGVGAAAAAGYLAIRYSPDDGKGINQVFNTMFAVPGGLLGGAMLGSTIGNVTMPGTRHAQLPADDAARVAEIDRELDGLLGAAS